jgi:putative MATE family efflux protein
MRDLTRGSILRHITTMAAPVLLFMLIQTLYFLVELYFVAAQGDAAVAGVSMGGALLFISASLSQVLGTGTAALTSHAVGRRDVTDVKTIFCQAMGLSWACAGLLLVSGYALIPVYVGLLSNDPASIAAGAEYLHWFMPALALQLATVVTAATLRGMGYVGGTMVIYTLCVATNIVLAPILISGWGTGRPLGVAGAALGTALSNLAAVILLWLYFLRVNPHVLLSWRQLRPTLTHWKRILRIGLPAGGEMALMFVYTALTFWAIRSFGAAAQAGFGLGSRLMQMLLAPVVAIAFVAVPIAGQNFGARDSARVRQTFHIAAGLNVAFMFAVTVALQWRAEALIRMFSSDEAVVAVGTLFLELASLGFMARGFAYACSGLFQGLGITTPSLLCSAIALVAFALPAFLLASHPGFRLEYVWYLWAAAAAVQAVASFVWLRIEMKRRMQRSTHVLPVAHPSTQAS